MEFKNLPKDLLSPILALVDPEDLVQIGSCGDKKFMERLSREGFVSSVTLTGPSRRERSGSFPFSALLTPAFSSLTRIVIHYESGLSSWFWDPCFLPSTLIEIDFSFHNAFQVFLQPLRDVNDPHWMRQPMYSNHRTPSEQLFTPMLLCDTFPRLEKLRISVSALLSPKSDCPVHWGVKRQYRDLLHPALGVQVNWTQEMFWLFLKRLPSSLTSLDLSISANTLEKVPELPPNLTSLRHCEGIAPATNTPRFWLKLPESHRPDLSTLSNFQWDYYYNSANTVAAAAKFASEIRLFSNIRSLDISTVHFQSVADLKLLPRYLTQLKFNFHAYDGGTLKMGDVSTLPRTITHLTLIQCPWVNSNNSNENANANNFCSLLPPNLTYFRLEDLNRSWKLERAFLEMRSSLRHLHILVIDTPLLELETFDPWLPCDTLHTLEIITRRREGEGNVNVDSGLFSSWPTDIPNNIRRLKFSISNYRGEKDPYEDECLQKLPPHLTSLTLEGCFLISPPFFGILPKSVAFLELSTCCFTQQLRETNEENGDDDVAGEDSEEERKEGEEEEEEEEAVAYGDCLKDTVIVRHCPKHIIELRMNYIFTGAFLPSNATKLKSKYHGSRVLEVTPRLQLPNPLRYCNLSYLELASNCIIPDTLTELDFGDAYIDMALVSKTPNLQRLTGSTIYHPIGVLSTCSTSLKSLRLFSSLDYYFVPSDEDKGKQTALISLQELALESAWTQEASAYKLSQQFPNIISLKIVHHKNLGNQGKQRLLFPTISNKKQKKNDGGLDAGSTIPQQLPPVLSKLQHLEARNHLITQSHLKHVTPNLRSLTIGSVSIDNLKEILQSLTPDKTELISEIEIIKTICPSITTLGIPPPKILFLGQDISFPADCKALLTQLETLEEEDACGPCLWSLT